MSYFRSLPDKDMEKIVQTITKFDISALLVIGGFEVECRSCILRVLTHCIIVTSEWFSVYICW